MRRLAAACGVGVVLAFSADASSARGVRDDGDIVLHEIPAGDAAEAVKSLARLHKRAVLFHTEDLQSVATNPVSGRLSLEAALARMFEGTPLQGSLTESGAITIAARTVEQPLEPRNPDVKRSAFILTTALSALAANAAISQDNPPATENDDVIVVVGSQIKGADIAGTLPVTVLDTDDIEITGAVSGEELFESIPQLGAVLFNGTQFVGVNGARGDVGSVNLRAIGTGNTLVLLNGRRLVLHPGTQVENLVPVNSVNTNALPVTGIERLEILRDGAAALYGTDAVAGVINTILKDDFTGFTATLQYGGSEGTDLRELSGSFEFGVDFNEGRSNFSLFGSFLDREGIPASQRFYSASEDLRPLFVGTPYENDTQLRNLSTAAPWGEFRSLAGSIPAIGDDDFHVQPDTLSGCLVPLSTGICADNGGSIDTALRHDRALVRDLVGDTTRGNIFAFLNHEFDGGVEFFGEFSYYLADFERQREQANVLSSARIVIPDTAFYNPFGVDLQIRDLRPIDAGPRQVEVKNDSFRILGGLRGDFQGWDWETAILHSEAKTDDTTTRISNTLFQQAIADTTASAYNPFAIGDPLDINSPSTFNDPATIASFVVPVSRISETGLTLADFKLSNPDIFELPGGSVGVAMGAEWRHESFEDDRDARLDGTITFTDLVTGDVNLSDVLGSSNTPDTDGDRDVFSLFVETIVPLVGPEMNIPLVEKFDVQLSARYENFSDVGDILKPKVAVSWYPAAWLQIRGAYAEGFRAPNLEQINATGIRRVNTNREDWILCEATATANGTPFNSGDCDGVSVESVRSGGPDLEPETNTNKSIGLVFQPPSLGFTFTVDYWEIKQENTVGIFGDQDQISLDYLLRTQGSSNPNVVRLAPTPSEIALYTAAGLDPAGEILEVIDNYTNLNPREASGVDFGLYYELDTDFGDFDLSFNAAYLEDFFQTPGPNGAAIIAAVEAGTIDSSVEVGGIDSLKERNGRPEWRYSGSLRWSKGAFGAGAFVRYVGDFVDTSTTTSSGVPLPIDPWTIVSLQADYTIGKNTDAPTRIRVGVRNVTDEDPPVADEFGTGYFDDLHSNRGRYWYASVRKSF